MHMRRRLALEAGRDMHYVDIFLVDDLDLIQLHLHIRDFDARAACSAPPLWL